MEFVYLVSNLCNHTSRIAAEIKHALNVLVGCFVIKDFSYSDIHDASSTIQEAVISNMMPIAA